MIPGDLVRYARQADEKELLGLVIKVYDWDHPSSRKVQVQWFNYHPRHCTKRSWHHDLVLEVIGENT
jgi:hypothetical protein